MAVVMLQTNELEMLTSAPTGFEKEKKILFVGYEDIDN